MVHVWMVKTDRVLSEEEAAALTACLPPERRVRLAGQLPRQQAEVLWAYGLLLALLREREGENCRRMGRVYQALGVTGGAFLMILLL